jgi:arylsulfatase A-like enzyme
MKRSFVLLAALLVATSSAAADKNSSPPNIVFCIADDASPTFGAYGYDWVRTPNIDALAKQGIVFEHCFTPTAKCAPSRAATLTGRNPWQLESGSAHQNFFPPNYKTFTELLSERGAHVGAQGKFWGPGNALTADGAKRTFGLVSIPTRKGPEPGDALRAFLSERPKDKPFFFWYGSTDPHRAYELDSGIAAGKKPADIDHVPAFWPDNDTVRRDMLDYAIEIEKYDAQVGSVLKALEESGEADNTLVIVTSDHGMPFPRSKGHNYPISNHIPFIVRWPSGIKNPGRRVADFISLIDVAPTVLDLYGVAESDSGLSKITGGSLRDVFENSPTRDRSVVFTGRERNDVYARPGTPTGLGYPIRAIREGTLFYLHNFKPDRWPCGNPELGLLDTDASPTKALIENLGPGDKYWEWCFGKRPQEELYDLASDPDCVKNLAEDSAYRAQATALREQVFAELRRQEDPRILGNGDVFDNYPTVKPPPGTEKKPKAAKKAKAAS